MRGGVASPRVILHADLDAFYASVEQLLNPSLRGKPIAVGGGVVLAASYEARAFGVKGGMSGATARRLCPQLRFVNGHFREYQRLADRVMTVFDDFTPDVERISIDEAFLDVTGSLHLFGPPRVIAETIRARVRSEIGLPVSIGGASTKHLAKVASDVAKPDGLIIVEPGTERAFLDPLPVGLVWGVGPKTNARLASRGITTIGQLAETNPEHLRHLLGSVVSRDLYNRARNDDARRVRTRRRVQSVGAQSACGRREPSPEFVRATLGHLADRVARRMRSGGRVGRTISVRVRFADLSAITRSTTLAEPTAATLTLVEIGEELVRSALNDHPTERFISLLAISVSGLVDEANIQLELPFESGSSTSSTSSGSSGSSGSKVAGTDARRAGSLAASDRVAADRAMDQVRERFGSRAVGYWSHALRGAESVPEEFRELAQGDA